MMATTLNLQTVELISTLRTVPANGSPSSTDYNDSFRETLADLASLSEFINDTLLPIINALPTAASGGLYGDALNASSDVTNPLFYSSSEQRQLTVAEVLSAINAANSAIQKTVTDLNARVLQLSTKLATTNQTDMLSTVNALSAQFQQVLSTVDGLVSASASQATWQANVQRARITTGNIAASGNATINLMWPQPFANAYTAVATVDDASGLLEVMSVEKLGNNAGVAIKVYNLDPNAVHAGELNAIAISD